MLPIILALFSNSTDLRLFLKHNFTRPSFTSSRTETLVSLPLLFMLLSTLTGTESHSPAPQPSYYTTATYIHNNYNTHSMNTSLQCIVLYQYSNHAFKLTQHCFFVLLTIFIVTRHSLTLCNTLCSQYACTTNTELLTASFTSRPLLDKPLLLCSPLTVMVNSSCCLCCKHTHKQHSNKIM